MIAKFVELYLAKYTNKREEREPGTCLVALLQMLCGISTKREKSVLQKQSSVSRTASRRPLIAEFVAARALYKTSRIQHYYKCALRSPSDRRKLKATRAVHAYSFRVLFA
jgi:hypothetical protein